MGIIGDVKLPDMIFVLTKDGCILCMFLSQDGRLITK